MMEQQQQRPKQSMNPMILMMLSFIPMIVMWRFADPIGEYVNYILYPLLGFNGDYLVLTVFCAGAILAIFNTLMRHLVSDWKEQAKSQQISKAFSKEMRAAQMNRDVKRMEKLRKQQQEIMAMSMAQSSKQMKIMPFTMVFAICIIIWLYYFLGDQAGIEEGSIAIRGAASTIPLYAHTPWNMEWDLLGRSFMFPNFMWMYMLISIPLGHAFTKILQLFTIKKERKNEDYIIREKF